MERFGATFFNCLLAILVSALTSAFSAPSAASTKSKTKVKPAPQEAVSVRQEALRQLDQIPTQSNFETPSVMLPLKAEYNPIARRAWDWLIEMEIAQRQLNVPRPQDSLGPANLRNLPAFSFFGGGVGFEKSGLLMGQTLRFGVIVHGAISVASSETTLNNGTALSTRYQWLGYGFEPRLTWNFTRRFAVVAGLGLDQVTVVQSSQDSELAQWTRNYRENSRRLALQYSTNQQLYVSLALRQIENEFEAPNVYSLNWGARW